MSPSHLVWWKKCTDLGFLKNTLIILKFSSSNYRKQVDLCCKYGPGENLAFPKFTVIQNLWIKYEFFWWNTVKWNPFPDVWKITLLPHTYAKLLKLSEMGMSTLVVVRMHPFSLVGAIWFLEIQGAPKSPPWWTEMEYPVLALALEYSCFVKGQGTARFQGTLSQQHLPTLDGKSTQFSHIQFSKSPKIKLHKHQREDPRDRVCNAWKRASNSNRSTKLIALFNASKVQKSQLN